MRSTNPIWRHQFTHKTWLGLDGLWGRRKKENGSALNLPDRFPRFDVFEGHGDQVALQRCPILRDILTIAKSPPCLQPKTNKQLTRLEFDHISSFS
jgi:hypothetical protein